MYSDCDGTLLAESVYGDRFESITHYCTKGTTYYIRVNDWGNLGNIFEISLTCPSEDWVIISNVIWATRNVDMPGTFAANPESAGMFYQWNRKVGWSSTDPLVNSNGVKTWDNSIPKGDGWISENDPCPTGWRVPTLGEVFGIWDKSEWTTINGVNGRKFGGQFNSISLFLQAAGRRDNSGILSDAGYRGFYWTSNMDSDGNPPFLLIYDDGRGWALWFESRYGLSIRCVKKDFITSIEEKIVQKIKLFPNPAQSELFIKSELPVKKIEIYSLTGVLMISEQNFYEKISVFALPKGIYIIKVHTANNVITQKFIKE